MKLMNLAFLVFLLMFSITQTAHSANTPTAYMQSLDNQLKPLLKDAKKNEARILRILNQMLDFDTLCKESLGRHWNQRTKEEQEDFSKTLKALIEKNVVSRLESTKENNIIYKSEKVTGNKAKLVTIVKDGDGPRAAEFEIIYDMVKKGNRWVAVDMITDGMSLISNYRSQFNKMIEEEGFESMMKKMKDKLAE